MIMLYMYLMLLEPEVGVIGYTEVERVRRKVLCDKHMLFYTFCSLAKTPFILAMHSG